MAKHLELANHFANFSQKSRFIFGSVEAFFFCRETHFLRLLAVSILSEKPP